MADQEKLTKAEKEARLQYDLEATWQDEAPQTAKRTEFVDQVDGEIGTRRKADDYTDPR